MHYTISHALVYEYSQPVVLDTHILRLCPWTDWRQTLKSYALQILPSPDRQVQVADLDGNTVKHLYFSSTPLSKLQIQMQARVETHCENPFDFLLSRWAAQLPLDYPSTLKTQLSPYLHTNGSTLAAAFDPHASTLAQTLAHETNGNVVMFLCELNQRINTECAYVIRETGAPQLPGITWSQKSGSCRDYVMLFIEVCRAVGLAARFVSGYHEGDPDTDEFHLHAWAEVYLPGAGWRGFDPTLGLAVGDRHVALAASPFPSYAAPFSGKLQAGSRAESKMSYQLSISSP
ncbi:MAG: transglutaminase family protein [Leptolyngbyaceae bacterium]|nr:transglutaminase family protein [Leptolyngbyaceae bacterium]